MLRQCLNIYVFLLVSPFALGAEDAPSNTAAQPSQVAALSGSSGLKSQVTSETTISPITAPIPQPVPVNQTLQQALDQIELLESSRGPYDAALSEQLVSLGVGYQQQGQHELAIEAFKRAMHIDRIHEGLYNLNQAPVFERLIESYVALGDWDEANDRHHHLYWLHRRNFGKDDPRMLPVLDKLSNWHINAFTTKGNVYYDHLINAQSIYNMAVEIIDDHYGTYDLRLIDELRGVVLSNYYLARFATEQPYAGSAFNVSTTNNYAEKKEQLARYVQNSYYSGKKAIDRMMSIYQHNPESKPTEATKARVELGDWYMLFNRPQSALEEYQSAYNEATSHSDSEALTLFDHPVALPAIPNLETKVLDNNAPHAYVLVGFDVSKSGRAYNIEILEAHPEDNNRIQNQVRQSLKAAKFRPRFENGEPVATAQLRQRYIFPE